MDLWRDFIMVPKETSLVFWPYYLPNNSFTFLNLITNPFPKSEIFSHDDFEALLHLHRKMLNLLKVLPTSYFYGLIWIEIAKSSSFIEVYVTNNFYSFLQTERKAYEIAVENGKLFYSQTGMLLDTKGGPQDAKWIFVLSTSKTLYVGQKHKGTFQHSSFLAGGATLSAGRLVVEEGILKVQKLSDNVKSYFLFLSPIAFVWIMDSFKDKGKKNDREP